MKASVLQGVSDNKNIKISRSDLNDWKRDIEHIIEHSEKRSIRQKALVTLYEINQRLKQ